MRPPRMTARTLLIPALFAALTGAGCSSTAAPATESVGASASAVIKGKNSDSSQDAAILLIYLDSSTGLVGACTGTMLAPNLVLTARHCVSDTDESAACDAKGDPIAGGEVKGNHKPTQMYVFVGKNRPDFAGSGGQIQPDGVGAKILTDGGTNLCNHDVAMVLLKDPISNVPISPIRLDGDVTTGETITAVGWGVTDKTDEPSTRQQRVGIKVEAVGPDSTVEPPVAPNEFQVGESICSGDSGGPAISASGAVIGVVSRGGNNTGGSSQDPSSNCTGSNTENLYSKTTAFKDFIMTGYAAANAEPWLEGGPDPRLAKAGETCTAAADCRSAICLADSSQKGALVCVDDCSTTECAEGTTCTASGDVKVCLTPATIAANNAATTTTTSGCSTSPASDSTFASIGAALFGLALVRRRKR